MTDAVSIPDRRQTDVSVVRRLIARQFPQWAHLPVRPVAAGGWDNQTFHLGDRMSVRLPTAREYALAVAKEHRWLPVFAPRVPLPISVPLAMGEPDEGYAFHWSVYEWIDGESAGVDTIGDLTEFADSLAAFLVALRHVDPAGGPEPGLHNWFRGGPVEVYDSQTRWALGELDGQIPRDRVTAVWQSALRSPWDGRPVWFHGDVALGNLLVRDGRLAAVIDFGTCGVGDPACDLAIAWTLLSGASREAFRARLDVDSATWARGRGWALWKALVTFAHASRSDHATAAAAKRVLDQVLTDG
ncbi:aminoglycoside phosphotransferase family protein [Phytohabitans aurantiacus]|uniref:Aminoglycoside phosphotransferase n=1 Tax=Phytohabitans aurantiacus TaxID=3016789 RepID=A0ABQ5QNX8_9ACTN|nr:aminoglycoside phosphotransferase family protein [Phytohabitans aurantiacus]GLH96355.1 aminoglycoside phosphotransferase [Phytohabitans aurantiacus]